MAYRFQMPVTTPKALASWHRRRRQLRYRWWAFLLIGIIGTAIFIWSWQTHDPFLFAILLLIPLLALRQAWRIDRQIRDCVRIISHKEIP